MSVCRRKITDLLNRDRFTNGHRFDGHFSGAGNRLVGGVCEAHHDVPVRRRVSTRRTFATPAPSIQRRACSAEPGRDDDASSIGQFSQGHGHDVLRSAPKKSRSATAAMYLNSEKPA